MQKEDAFEPIETKDKIKEAKSEENRRIAFLHQLNNDNYGEKTGGHNWLLGDERRWYGCPPPGFVGKHYHDFIDGDVYEGYEL